MDISYDAAKNAKNLVERGLSFERAAELAWEQAVVQEDLRCDYGETRWVALAPLEGRLHVLCFTETDTGIRVISFRKANAREVGHYEKQKTTDR